MCTRHAPGWARHVKSNVFEIDIPFSFNATNSDASSFRAQNTQLQILLRKKTPAMTMTMMVTFLSLGSGFVVFESVMSLIALFVSRI